jgi:FAD/FMN-containing dehydrogenase/Fe-S oxidoreductase
VSTTLWEELRDSVRGDVHADAVSRALYATDASIYQIEPAGVVLPRDEQDVAVVLRLARRYHVAVLPRGAGTSLAGQTVGGAIQLDFSKYMHRLLEVRPDEGYAWVEPGIVLDELNAQLAPQGVKFAPDVSPSNRATIGGMMGNNSSGMYSLVYGKTIDHVLELRVMLADGSVTTFGPLTDEELRAKLTLDSLEGRAYRTVRRLAREHADEVARRYPRLLRRVGGYNLDEFVPQKIEDRRLRIEDSAEPTNTPPSVVGGRWSVVDPRFNLTKIIVGSEGTLAVVLAAKIRVVPRPKHTAIGIVAFESLEAALDAVMPCLECRPSAVELMDEILLDLARTSRDYAKHLTSFVRGTPGGLLQVEFFGDTPAAVAADLGRLERHLRQHHELDFDFTRAITPAEQRAVLAVRKASMPLLQSMSPDRKPETFVEDSAVAPEKLGAYIRRFRQICADNGVAVAMYGHASVGLLHARPLLNLKDAADVVKLRVIAEAVKDLVLEFGGALSGEHGDGMLRSEFNRELFGDVLYEAFREIKRTFDPHSLLNTGKIVDAQPMDTNLRYGPAYQATVAFQSHFRFADTGGFAGAIELCNGNALCRKTTTGTMCPSYMVTRDEEHSTRGRANALRMVISGALPPSELTSERMHDVMDLCLECKGCTGECPSRVNMTQIKAEWLAQYYRAHSVPLRARLFGHIHLLNQIGSALAPLANLALQAPGASILGEKLLGISRHRHLPRFVREPFHTWFQKHQNQEPRTENRGNGAGSRFSVLGSRTVVLFPDTFTDYNEPRIGQAAVRVLEAAGYEVLLPRRPLCCGRPLISKGLLDQAQALARRQMEWLAPYAEAGLPIVGLEPSCLLTFRDEYPDLLDDPRAGALARQSFLFDEFLAREIREGRATLPFRDHRPPTTDHRPPTTEERSPTPDPRPPTPDHRQYLLHGHCHQKALVGTAAALELLRLIPGAEVREVDSGCCGMAGSFGYEAEHYAISQKIGERALFPAVRALPPAATVVAMGTSCRHQIADGTGRQALHLAEALAEALAPVAEA